MWAPEPRATPAQYLTLDGYCADCKYAVRPPLSAARCRVRLWSVPSLSVEPPADVDGQDRAGASGPSGCVLRNAYIRR